MKKKIVYTLLVFGLLIVCGGCVNSSKKRKTQETKKAETVYTNKQVAADVKKAMNDRWDYIESIQEAETNNEAQQQWINGTAKLSDGLDKYSDDNIKFKDSNTKKLMNGLTDIILMQSTLSENYMNAPTKYAYNLNAYDERLAIQTKKIADKLQINFSKKRATALSSYVKSIKTPSPLIDDALKITSFKVANDPYGSGKEITIKVKNLTNFDFDQASVLVRFYDKDGTVLEDQNFDFDNLKGNQSMRAQDSMNSEDCGVKAEIVSYSFSNKTGPYQYDCYESETPFTKPITKEF